ncbi:MAG: NAD-dependent epimerase/dehydratase family protein [Flavobacteriaceae bacterium]
MNTIFVTGGSGFIGLHLVELLLKNNYKVHVLYRNSAKLEAIDHPNLSLFKGSLSNLESIERAARGCDGIIHVAGVAKQWAKDPELFNKVNIQGSINVFETAKKLGIKRVVNTSTAGTIPPSFEEQIPNENTTRELDYFFEYEASKARVEEIARDYCSEDLEIITVNPCRVYGPGEIGQSNSTVLMMDKYLRGKWKFMPGDGSQYGSFVYVEDVAQGMLQALLKGKSGTRYILGGENANYLSFFEYLKDLGAVNYKVYAIPLNLISSIAKVSGFLAKQFDIAPLMMPGVARKLFYDWKVDISKAQNELDYHPRPLKQGLEQTYQWWLEQNSKA